MPLGRLRLENPVFLRCLLRRNAGLPSASDGFKMVCFFMLTWLLFELAARSLTGGFSKHWRSADISDVRRQARPIQRVRSILGDDYYNQTNVKTPAEARRAERFRDNDSSPTKNFGNRGASTLFPIQGPKPQQTKACKDNGP